MKPPDDPIATLSTQYPSLHPFGLVDWAVNHHRVLRAAPGTIPTYLVMHSIQGIVDRAAALSSTAPAAGDPSLRSCYSTLKYIASEMTLPGPVLPPIHIVVPLEDIQEDIRLRGEPHDLWHEYAEILYRMQPVPRSRNKRVPNLISLEEAHAMTGDEFVTWVRRLTAPPDERAEWALPNTIQA